MDKARLQKSLNLLGDALRNADFELWQATFFREHAQSFRISNENRLEYMQIYENFQAGLEEYLLQALAKSDITLEELEAVASQPCDSSPMQDLDDEAEAALQFILGQCDFLSFKTNAISHLQRCEQAEKRQLGSLLDEFPSTDVYFNGLHDLLPVQLSRDTLHLQWKKSVCLDWMEVEFASDENTCSGEICMRGAWVLNLGMNECCDLFFTLSSRRRMWDTHFVSAELHHGEHFISDDIVVSIRIDMGCLLHWAGLPREYCVRIFRRWNHPGPGAVTIVTVPWNNKLDCYNKDSTFLRWTAAILQPYSLNDNKCLVTFLTAGNTGLLPDWVVKSLVRVMPPQIAKGLETRYIANVQAKGGIVDASWLKLHRHS